MKKLPINLISKHFDLLVGVFVFCAIALLLVMSFYIINSPSDYLQEDLVRIMYIHVPAAWLGLGIYSCIAMFSICFVIFKNPQYFLIAKNLVTIGACYTSIALFTGAAWGKPAWGTWWVWDARLTSMLLLLFIYIGYKSISQYDSYNYGSAVVSSYYAITSFIVIPIIKFSVDIWSTLHQPSSVFKLTGSSIHPEMLKILVVSFFFHVSFTCLIVVITIQTDILDKKNKKYITNG
ncbi:MAG: heme exporter protein [Candidatus Midichloriaceae bacterium]|jgi:heme exporter protein C|nr:heme exporter protein [Candidatus Midichloriaceae bacterium]